MKFVFFEVLCALLLLPGLLKGMPFAYFTLGVIMGIIYNYLLSNWQIRDIKKISMRALSYYADEDNYSHYDNNNNIICEENCGDVAREALEKIKE